MVVAEFYNEADADMTVALLKGNGVPAARLPAMALTVSAFGMLQPVRVLVPPDRAQGARQLIEGGDLETEAPQPEAAGS